jgi:hypothetical protein
MESSATDAEPQDEGTDDSETDRLDDDARTSDSETDRLDDEERFAELEASLRAEFPKVERVVTLPTSRGDGDGLLLIVFMAWNASKTEPWARRITAACTAKGLTVYPAVYPWRHWNELERGDFADQWKDALNSDAPALSLVDIVREHGRQPKSLRRMLLRQVKGYRRLVEHLKAYSPVPLHVRLSLCAEIHRRVLELLFATKGERFEPGTESLERYGEVFVKEKPSPPISHALDYFEMVALSSQAALSHELSRSRIFRRRSLQLFDETSKLLGAFRRKVLRELMTPAERRRRRVFIAINVTLAVLLATSGVGYYFYATQPEEPIADTSVIRRPGGILGTFYHGKGFNKLVLKKVSRHINFRTRKAFVKGVNTNHFTVRWTGYIQFPESEAKLLCVRYDDGARLYFNNRLVVNDWNVAGARLRCERVRVKKGWYPIKLEYFDTVGWAECRLRWGYARDKVKMVPSKHLCCR